MIATSTTIIGRLWLGRAGPDSQLACQRAARLLETVDLRPPGLPSSAVLCVRALHDPLPGRMDLARGVALPEWKQALADALGRLARTAARPALAAVPADAEAVLFADRAELLACLASDWCAGQIARRWWWPGLLRGDDPRAVVAAWLDAPEFAPDALELLAGVSRAAVFAGALHPDEARALSQRVAVCFGLGALHATLAGPSGEHGPAPLADEIVGQSTANHAQIAPWRAWAAESDAPGLAPDHQALLGIGLGLRRVPGAVRASSFAEQVRAWRAGELNGAPAPSPEDTAIPPTSPPRQKQMRPAVENLLHRSRTEALPNPRYVDKGDFNGSALAPEGEPAEDRRPDNGPWAEAAPSGLSLPTPVTRDAPEMTAPAARGTPDLTARSRVAARGATVTTELGGLFFLVNLGLFLDLYADFTSPLQPGIALDIWDFVALAGRDLLSQEQPDDPVWPLLAHLAGRDDDQPAGAGFVPLEEWRLPPAWLAPFPAHAPWRWSAGDGRLRAWHPAGFPALDLRLSSGAPGKQLRRELLLYGADVTLKRRSTVRARPHARDGSEHIPALARWLEWLMPYLRARLALALSGSPGTVRTKACENRTLHRSSVVAQLLQLRARVEVTAARLDVAIALADLPIAVRLAGLDRDPGWVPAAGRMIAFHFEVDDAAPV